ncbi:MAG: hypothetical protein D6689_15400 [Deltaproteobacteria bacterium]|nr:MAG: hypothetical protein D6689_15400 [Deltaproteobacteria bacterium]
MTAPIALLSHFPGLAARVPWAALGNWPTPVEPLDALARQLGSSPLWVKREDRAHPAFGGNKVRTLETLLARAAEAGAQRVWATGAYGSNHALCTAIHAPRVGLAAGALLVPQPLTATAARNLRALYATDCRVVALRSAAELPVATVAVCARRDERAAVMTPGGAVPRGALGHVSAALELAGQVAAGACPAPAAIVVACGSTCTAAGLSLGVHLAARLGIGWRDPPRIVAVRVTPWPVTSAAAIAALAAATSRVLARHVGPVARVGLRPLRAAVEVDARFLGGGYGRPSRAGAAAAAQFADAGGPPLDEVYSAKSAAAFVARARAGAPGPLLYWASRSSAPQALATAGLPRHVRRWLAGPPARPG